MATRRAWFPVGKAVNAYGVLFVAPSSVAPSKNAVGNRATRVRSGGQNGTVAVALKEALLAGEVISTEGGRYHPERSRSR